MSMTWGVEFEARHNMPVNVMDVLHYQDRHTGIAAC